MDTITIGAVITVLIIFFIVILRIIYIRGYRAGGTKILIEWKKWIKQVEDENNEQHRSL